jgi:hypothetical protein
MPMPMSSWAKDTFIAPHLSEFNSAAIKDMSHYKQESDYLIQGFILNSIFRSSLQLAARQTMLNFLRRSEAAFRAYEDARIETASYVADGSINGYMRAMSHWEFFFSQAWLGYALIIKMVGVRAFAPNDGSLSQRLHRLYNQTKHVESMIADGNMAADSTLPVWLTNDGIQSNEVAVTFDELADILENIILWARRFRDPAAMKEAIERGEDLP